MSEEKREETYYNSSGLPESSSGEVRVSNDVIASVAAFACKEIDGFNSLSEGFAAGLGKLLQGDLNEGVIVRNVNTLRDEYHTVEIDLSVVLNYGFPIQTIASKLQNIVKDKVESSCGVFVSRVNITISGIRFAEK